MSAVNPDPGLEALERWLNRVGASRWRLADPVRCAPKTLVAGRYNLAHFYFRRLFPGLPRPCYWHLEDLAISYMLEPSRYA